MKIGLMGGTFNPVHKAHLNIAEAAYRQFSLDIVYFMPSGHPGYKDDKELASGENRLKMIELAIEGIPYFKTEDIELLRPGNTYTSDTLRELKVKYPNDDFYIIMGADSIMYLERWHEPDVICKYASILVAGRNELPVRQLELQRDMLIKTFNADISFIKTKEMDISSSNIRKAVKDNDMPYLSKVLPKKELKFIIENRLYL